MTRRETQDQQIGYLRQCLSSDKRPLGVFLGAGCPLAIPDPGAACAPLIPDIRGMTVAVRKELAARDECAALLEIVDGHFVTDERGETTVEDVLTHLRALRAVAGRDRVRGLAADEIDLLDGVICDVIHDLANKALDGVGTPYHQIAAWAGAVPRSHAIEFFSTNYDLLLEQALEDRRVPYFDGFAGVRKPFFDLRAMEEDALPPRWARLWKLHGSINWYQTPGSGVFRGSAGDDAGARRVIHPSHLKYEESRRMPYLAMMDRLRAFLRQPGCVLVTSGYSFRDEHVNEAIVQSLQASPSSMAFGLLFGPLREYPMAVALSQRCTNLSLLADDRGIVNCRECDWEDRAVEWESDPAHSAPNAADLEVTDENARRQFDLGDFCALGRFLEGLASAERRWANTTDD